ncbi:hypothetical protein Cni_G25235 [Canna indica]|uniref:FLZ-type domain-containing protein n=1 Tax=Canna indica TaxID=4628 RepID=A0AAQ3L0Q4_9LILI|nr:hypothetical protein Cni_G25235 [Canna indica]
MAGLSVLLETPTNFPKRTQIISKTSFLKSSSSSSSRGSAFLEHCFLCRRKLQQGEDIYMYRGDRGFCSEECRRRQIYMDEESGKKDCCSLAAASASAEGAERRRRRATGADRGRAIAGGGVAY